MNSYFRCHRCSFVISFLYVKQPSNAGHAVNECIAHHILLSYHQLAKLYILYVYSFKTEHQEKVEWDVQKHLKHSSVLCTAATLQRLFWKVLQCFAKSEIKYTATLSPQGRGEGSVVVREEGRKVILLQKKHQILLEKKKASNHPFLCTLRSKQVKIWRRKQANSLIERDARHNFEIERLKERKNGDNSYKGPIWTGRRHWGPDIWTC